MAVTLNQESHGMYLNGVNLLFQKTDFAVTDTEFATPSIYYFGQDGVLQSSQANAQPFYLWPYKTVLFTVNFSAATGTTPSLTFFLAAMDNATGPTGQNFAAPQIAGNTNLASGGFGFLQTNSTGTTSTTNAFTPLRPAWAVIQVVTSGTFTTLGATNRLSVIGIR